MASGTRKATLALLPSVYDAKADTTFCSSSSVFLAWESCFFPPLFPSVGPVFLAMVRWIWIWKQQTKYVSSFSPASPLLISVGGTRIFANLFAIWTTAISGFANYDLSALQFQGRERNTTKCSVTVNHSELQNLRRRRVMRASHDGGESTWGNGIFLNICNPQSIIIRLWNNFSNYTCCLKFCTCLIGFICKLSIESLCWIYIQAINWTLLILNRFGWHRPLSAHRHLPCLSLDFSGLGFWNLGFR